MSFVFAQSLYFQGKPLNGKGQILLAVSKIFDLIAVATGLLGEIG